MIRVICLTVKIAACPMRLTGQTPDGHEVSVNYRWGFLTIHIDNTEDGWTLARQVGGENDGWISLDEIREITAGVVDWFEDLDF